MSDARCPTGPAGQRRYDSQNTAPLDNFADRVVARRGPNEEDGDVKGTIGCCISAGPDNRSFPLSRAGSAQPTMAARARDRRCEVGERAWW